MTAKDRKKIANEIMGLKNWAVNELTNYDSGFDALSVVHKAKKKYVEIVGEEFGFEHFVSTIMEDITNMYFNK